MNQKQIEAELRLFETYTEDDIAKVQLNTGENYISYKGIAIIDKPNQEIIDIAERLYGISSEEWNNTFHKSFAKVINTPIEQLVVDQIIHYFTTYGLEALGLYNSEYVYIPKEELDIPDMEKDFKLTIIKQISLDELKEKLLTLINSGIALSKQTIDDIMELEPFFFNSKDIMSIKQISNREIRALLFKKYDLVPYDPEDYLRWFLTKTIDQSLIIKNRETIRKLKTVDEDIILNYLTRYLVNDESYKELATIFLRHKELFLALKRNNNTNTSKAINKIINKLDKLCRVKGYKKLANKNITDTITGISDVNIINLGKEMIIKELNKMTIFKEIRLVNSLRYRLLNNSNMVYKIRNGKVWTEEVEETILLKRNIANQKSLDIVYNHLKTRVYNLLKDKSVYIPMNVEYMAPTSEKQFIGSMPFGSYIKIPRDNDMIVGVHWFNYEDEKTDLDLHMMNLTSQFGWNTAYRSEGGDIAFTGDITDAPKPLGATEAFLISKDCPEKSFLLKLNDFTRKNKNVPYDIVIAKGVGSKNENRHFIIDPNDIIVKVSSAFNKTTENSHDMSLGLVDVKNDNLTFSFNNFDLGNKSISSYRNECNKILYQYLNSYYKTQLTLRQLLLDSGIDLAIQPFTEKLEEVKALNEETGKEEILYRKIQKMVDYNLSLENLSLDSLIKLFMGE